MEVVGGVSGVITVITSVTKLAKNLNEIRESYNNVALNTTLVASHLTTIRCALEAIAEWRKGAANDFSQSSKRLDEDLAVSLNCCAILITVIDSKLGESAGMKAKIRHVWLEDVLKGYLSNLDGQVRALQLLLTIFQCRTATEQSQRLERQEHRTVIEKLRAETASLQPDSRELHDAASMLSMDPSVNLEVDSELLRSDVYKKVYGHYHIHRPRVVSSHTKDEPHYQHRLQQLDGTAFHDGEDIHAPQASELTSSNKKQLPHTNSHEANGSVAFTLESSRSNEIDGKQGDSAHINSRSNELERDEPISKDMVLDLLPTSSALGVDFTADTFHLDRPTSGAKDGNSCSAKSLSCSQYQKDTRLDPSGNYYFCNADHATSQNVMNQTSVIPEPTRSIRSTSIEIDLYDASILPRRSIQLVDAGYQIAETDPFDDPHTTSSIDDIDHSSITLDSVDKSTSNTDTDIEALQPSTNNPTVGSQGSSTSEENRRASRDRAQMELSKLQRELADAKARGDKKSAQASLEKSIQLIRETYLPSSSPIESPKISSSPKSKSRSLLRLPSVSSFSPIQTRHRKSQTAAAMEAVQTGNKVKLKETLDQGINVNHRYKDFTTLLVQAAVHGRIGCMELLKECGADELAVNDKGQNVLHLAVLAQKSEAVQWLLTAYPSTEDETQGEHRRKSNKTLSISRLLSQHPIRETSDRAGFKPIHTAAYHGMANMVTILLASGADIEAKNNIGGTPLHTALHSENCAEISKILLSNGANPQAADAQGMTPLHCVASAGNVNMIHMLTTAGAKRRSTYNYLGDLPIHTAVRNGHLPAIEALVTEPTDLESTTSHGDTLLHIAVLTGQTHVVDYLFQKNVNPNPWSQSAPAKLADHGWMVYSNVLPKKARRLQTHSTTPLHFACFAGNYEMAVLLLDHQALVNAATADGKSPLMLAVESDDTNLVYLLLARGAKVDTRLPDSLLTVMHLASEKGNLETLRVLYQHGAGIDGRTSDSNSPYEFALLCKDLVKRQAVLEWYQGIRRNRAAQAKEINARNRQRDEQQNPQRNSQQTPQQNQQHYTMSPQYQLPERDQIALIRQLSPPYNQFDPEYDAFPEAPPPYVAGPSAPERLARRDPVYRPPN